MPDVFHAGATIAAILNAAEDGELTDEQEQQIQEACGSLEGYAEWLRDQQHAAEGRISVRKARIDQLRAANAADERQVERRKARLLAAMLAAGIPKIKTPLVSVHTRATASIVVECDVSTLPACFQRVKTTVEADKIALRAAADAGNALPDGVRLEEATCVILK